MVWKIEKFHKKLFLTRPYIFKSLVKPKNLGQENLQKKIGFFHENQDTFFPNSSQTKVPLISLKKKSKRKLVKKQNTVKKNNSLDSAFRRATSSKRFKRKLSFFKYRKLVFLKKDKAEKTLFLRLASKRKNWYFYRKKQASLWKTRTYVSTQKINKLFLKKKSTRLKYRPKHRRRRRLRAIKVHYRLLKKFFRKRKQKKLRKLKKRSNFKHKIFKLKIKIKIKRRKKKKLPAVFYKWKKLREKKWQNKKGPEKNWKLKQFKKKKQKNFRIKLERRKRLVAKEFFNRVRNDVDLLNPPQKILLKAKQYRGTEQKKIVSKVKTFWSKYLKVSLAKKKVQIKKLRKEKLFQKAKLPKTKYHWKNRLFAKEYAYSFKFWKNPTYFKRRKGRFFFRVHRWVRRHLYGYQGTANFFSKKKDTFQLYKTKRSFFQQVSGAISYKEIEKKQKFSLTNKLQNNFWWVCSSKQVPGIFQKKQRIFRRFFFVTLFKGELRRNTRRIFKMQKKLRKSFQKKLGGSHEKKKMEILTKNLALKKKKNHFLFKNIKIPSLLKKKQVFSDTSRFKSNGSFPLQIQEKRFFSNLAWKFVEKRKKIRGGKKKRKKNIYQRQPFLIWVPKKWFVSGAKPLKAWFTKAKKKRNQAQKTKTNSKYRVNAELNLKILSKNLVKPVAFVQKTRRRGPKKLANIIETREKKQVLKNQDSLLLNAKPRLLFGKKKFRFRRWRAKKRTTFKYRFPRFWKYYSYFWRWGLNNSGPNAKKRWIQRELYSYRLYRKIHRIYRIKNPRKAKKNKWIVRLEASSRNNTLQNRYKRLVSRLMHFKLFSKFYGPFTPKKVTIWSKHFQKVTPYKITRKALALAWFDRKIDVTVYRLGLAPSLKVAQVLVKRGFIFVNGQQILNLQHRMQVWDIIAVAPLRECKAQYYWYWFIRNRYKRYAFKKKNNHHHSLSSNRLIYPFGFWMSSTRVHELPRTDQIQAKEFERLLLSR